MSDETNEEEEARGAFGNNGHERSVIEWRVMKWFKRRVEILRTSAPNGGLLKAFPEGNKSTTCFTHQSVGVNPYVSPSESLLDRAAGVVWRGKVKPKKHNAVYGAIQTILT